MSNVDYDLMRKRGTVLAAMKDITDQAGVSRARLYVWLKKAFNTPEIKVGAMSDAECDALLKVILKEMSDGYVNIREGIKPLHHRNSLAGSVHEARLYMFGALKNSYVVVSFSGRRWQVDVDIALGQDMATQAAIEPCQIEFRGEFEARVYLKTDLDQYVATIPVGRMWRYST